MRLFAILLSILSTILSAGTEPLAAGDEEKPRLAVLGWEARGASAEQAEAVAEEMRSGFTRSNKYTVVDRTLTAKILEEWERQQSGLNESERAIQVGKLYNVRFIITGKVIRLEGNAWQVSAVLLDAQTGVTRDSQTLRHRGEYFDLLGQIAALSARLAGLETGEAQAAAVTPPRAEAGTLWTDPTTGMEFVYVPGGDYEQGCHAQAGECEDSERPSRRVRLSSFWLGKYEVTVGQFRQFVNQTGYRTDAERGDGCWTVKADGSRATQADKNWRDPGYVQDDGYPVVCVSWNDATSFAQWLSSKSGQAFALPSEAQWEYACRAGGQLITYAWGNGDPYIAGRPAGNIADESAKRKFSGWTVWQRYDDGFAYSAPVGRFAPNGLGLHDMTGNVWEWVQDVYSADAYRGSASDDPIYQGSGADRVLRGGGSYSSALRRVRCSYRGWGDPGDRYDVIGFRLARTN